jgi:hypothetical protein
VAAQLDNLRIGSEGVYFDQQAARTVTHSTAVSALACEFLQSLEKGRVMASLCTPGFGEKRTPLFAIVYDQLATPHGRGDAYMQEFVSLLGAAMRSEDIALRMKAAALGAQLAMEYARFHAGDMETR